MTITNKTHWDTRSLRAIIARVAAEELEGERYRFQRKKLRVRVVYTRPGRRVGDARLYASGCAYLRGFEATLRVSKEHVDPIEFAWLCAHEFAHVRGMQHRQMPDWLNNRNATSRIRYAWAADFPVVRKAAKPAPSAEAKADAKLLNIRVRLALAETRAKRATTILKKWQRRERALLTRLQKAAVKATS